MNSTVLRDAILMTISYVFSFLPAMLLLYLPFHKVIKKKDRFFFLYGSIAIIILLMAVSFCYVYFFGMQDIFYKVNSAVFYFLTVFLLIHCCKEKRSAILFNFGIIGIVILTISGFTLYIVDYFPTKSYYFEMTVLYFGLFALISIPLFYFILQNTKMLISIEQGEEWADIWFLPVSIMVVCAFSTPLETHVSNIWDMLCRLTCGIFAIAVSQYLSYSREVQNEKHRLLTELSSQKEYYKEISRKLQEDRKVRHDFRHAILAIRTYIDEDNKEGLVQYCEKLLEKSNLRSDLPHSGNSVTDGILYRYTLLCEENEVLLSTNGAISNDVIDDMDLCVLFGNAMENAFEACQRMKDGKKWIKVRIEESPDLFTIAISNSHNGKIRKRKDKFLSSKRKTEEGIGLQSIHEICEKYSGTMHISYDDDEFNIMMLLNLKSIED